MNKKQFAFFSLVLTLLFVLPGMPKAEASSKILDVLASEDSTAAVQEFVQVGAELKAGNTETLKNIVVTRVLEEAGITGEASTTIVKSIKEMDQGAKPAEVVAKLAQNTVKEKVKARLSERLAPHTDTILLIESLFLPTENNAQTAK
jgi:hypothetical protein